MSSQHRQDRCIKTNLLQALVLSLALLTCLTSTLTQADTPDFNIKNGSHAPKLIASIDDQTLSISQQGTSLLGPLNASQYYTRNLHDSFDNVANTNFSAYAYNDDVVDAFIVDHQLLVVAKERGITKVAITAENKHGSMIDWFVVTVEGSDASSQSSAQATSTGSPGFNESLFYVPANRSSGIEVHFPLIDANEATYKVYPALPLGLRFDTTSAVLNGSLQDALDDRNLHYYIAIDHSGQVAVQRFALYESNRTDRAFLYATEPNQSRSSMLDTYVAQIGLPQSFSVSRYLNNPPGNLPTRQALASRAPMSSRYLQAEQTSIRQQFLHGWTSALHSRFRNESNDATLQDQSSMTVWQYASTRSRGNINFSSQRPGSQRTGIYVGFDAQLEENWTTGLSVGFDHDSIATSHPIAPNSSKLGMTPAMTTVSPYARWHDGDGSEIWGMVGFGRDNSTYGSRSLTNRTGLLDNAVVLGAIGWRQLLGSRDNIEVATVGDFGFVMPLSTESDTHTPNSLREAMTQSVRAGIEMSYAGEQIQPYFGISGLVDSNPIGYGTSLEAIGGVRYTSLFGITVEAEGRTHAPQWLNEQRAWVVSVAAHVDPGHQGRGLALSIAPRYGVNAYGLDGISSNPYSMYDRRNQLSPYGRNMTMSGTLSYGMPFGGSGVITPFGELAISTVNETRMGVRFELNPSLNKLLDFQIAGIQSRTYRNDLDKGVDLQLRLVF